MSGVIVGMVLSLIVITVFGGLTALVTAIVGVVLVAAVIALCLGIASLFAWLLGL